MTTAALAVYNLDQLPVTYDVTGVTAGTYSPSKKTIGINPVIAKANWDVYMETVLHEVAHAVDHASAIDKKAYATRRHKSGRRDMHGKYFKAILLNLHAVMDVPVPESTTCHDYEVPNARRQRRWSYICGECNYEYEISTVMHNRIQKGQGRICKCKAPLNKTHFSGLEIKC